MPRFVRSPWWSVFTLTAFVVSVTPPHAASAQARPRATRGDDNADDATSADDSGDEQTNATSRGPSGGAHALSGYELELHGTLAAHGGRAVRVRGVAYEVLGLATLWAGARVPIVAHEIRDGRAMDQVLAQATADASGRFALEIPMVSTVQLVVGRGDHARSFTFGLAAHSPARLELLTDRLLYEPGETVHVWARLSDLPSAAPLANVPVEITIQGSGSTTARVANARVRSSASGIAVLDVPLPSTIPDGAMVVDARVTDAVTSGADASVTIRVGRRTVERLMADARVDQQIVAPGARVTGRVTVRTPSGSPVRNATVEIRLAGREAPVTARTDAEGVASFSLSAPAYMAADIESQMLDVRIVHRAYGTVRTAASFTMARVPYAIEATASAGGVVPDVLSPVYLTLTDPRGEPPPPGTGVIVRSIGVPGGRWRGTTDRHGIVQVPMRLPAGSAAQHEVGRCAGRFASSFDVDVESTVPLSARVCVPVAPRASVIARAATPVVAPGGRVEVAIERAGSSRTRAVAVDLLHHGEDGVRTVLGSTVVPANETRAALTLPTGYVGVALIRARPVEATSAAEGTGASDAILVRPVHAFALNVAPERAQYHVRETARVLVRTPANLTGAHVALVARDLAAHGGEQPFALEWLRGTLSQSIADPSTPDADRLVRVALAAFVDADPLAARAGPLVPREGSSDDGGGDEGQGSYDPSSATMRGDLRDPFGLRDELLRRGLGPVMMALENAVDASIDEETHGVVAANRHAFEPTAIHALLEEGALEQATTRTLGGGEMTLAMLQAADPSFTFDRAARRVARRRLVRLLAALVAYLDPGEGARNTAASEPVDRWLSRMVQRGLLSASALRDPWGGSFVLRRVQPGRESIAIAVPASGWELVSPGPDRVAGTSDDVRNPFERVVPQNTVYSIASGEDALMRQLSVLDPGGEVLANVAAAYQRVANQASEESTVETVSASTSEATPEEPTAGETIGLGGIGTRGRGAGGGGMGFGAAAPRAAPAPAQVAAADDLERQGGREFQNGLRRDERHAADQTELRNARSPSGPRMAQLAALVRERFPATLRIIADAPIAESGTTPLEFTLADALTTYRVDAIAWTDEGWTSSASTDVRVDQDAVVDAPVPPFAVEGDTVRLPLRVSNRSQHAIRARVSVTAEGGLQLGATAPVDVEVAPGDAGEAIVPITLRTRGRGSLVINAVDAQSGAPLDAARRPMEVLPDARPVRMAVDTLVDEHGSLVFDVPADAQPRADGAVRVVVGGAIFGDPRSWGVRLGDPSWGAWAMAMSGSAPSNDLVERLVAPYERTDVEPEAWGIDAATVARAVGALWLVPSVGDALIQRGLAVLTRALEGYERLPRSALQSSLSRDVFGVEHARVLLGLAPAVAAAQRRAAIAEGLQRLVTRLRRSVEANTAPATDDPSRWASAAAALLVTSHAPSLRAQEFLRRAQRGVVRVADEVYLETVPGEPATRVAPSALYALATLGTSDRASAFAVARTLARLARTSRQWSAESRALATAMMGRLAPAHPNGQGGTVHLVVDGHATDVPLVQGIATHSSSALSQPGRHTVQIETSQGVTLIAEAEARYGRPWSAAPTFRGPFAVTLDGALGARDARAALTLRVQNRGPRVVASPVVEIDLPAGAELDEDARREIARRTTQLPTISGRTLVLTLRAMAPGGYVRIPLPVRWSVGGSLHGLGVAAYVSEEPGAGATILAPRVSTVADSGPEPSSPPPASVAAGGAQ
jgi:hypothetical protein